MSGYFFFMDDKEMNHHLFEGMDLDERPYADVIKSWNPRLFLRQIGEEFPT